MQGEQFRAASACCDWVRRERAGHKGQADTSPVPSNTQQEAIWATRASFALTPLPAFPRFTPLHPTGTRS